MDSGDWTVAQAKAKFSELIEHAERERPQIITRNGKRVAVVVSVAEWDRKNSRPGSLAEFFAASPLGSSGLRVSRSKDKMRKTGL